MKLASLAAMILAGTLASCQRSSEGAPPSMPSGPAQDALGSAGAPADWREAAKAARSRGAGFLAAASEGGRFRFAPDQPPHLGISALAAFALLQQPEEAHRRLAHSTLDWIVSFQKPDGGIYDRELAVYMTASAVLALSAAGRPQDRPVLARAAEYLRIAQVDEGEGIAESSEPYGGIGYGGRGDANLSTSQFAIEAAAAAGIPKDDAFYRKALVFLQRSQNRSESNDRPPVVIEGEGPVEVGNDGGGIYRPAESKAGIMTLPDGRKIFRSYGSMTYALLKSYLLCDLKADDPRVRAALDWIGKNWVLDHNPGMESDRNPLQKFEGLYYYYLTIARTLSAAERQGVSFEGSSLAAWREELARVLVARQGPDGSWVNTAERWFEASPTLATTYALLALGECLGPR
jgi:squalene-hopene/tetraprenyl-beta-curcumene cyclase